MARKATRKKSTAKRSAKKKTAKKKTAKRSTTKKRSTAKKTTRKKTATKKKSAAKRKPAAKKKAATKKKTSAKKSAAKKKTTATKAAPTAPAKKAAAKSVAKGRKATKPKNDETLSYTQSEFLENIRSFCGLEKKNDAKELWEDISLFIQDSLKRGYRVPLVGLGKMYVRKSKARMGRNPATGETIHIPARKRVRFSAAKALKDHVL